MKIQLLTGRHTVEPAEVAVAIARKRFPDHTWRLLVMDGSEGARVELEHRLGDAELLISFLNPHIFSERQLQLLGGRAYNVHPSTPEYPGTDPMHFAFYDGHYIAGATLHLMTEEIDAGPICAVAEEPVDRSIGLPAFSALCRELALVVLLENLPLLLSGDLSPNGRHWSSGNRRSHRDFLAMCKIDAEISEPELGRRLEAFYHPRLPDRPFIELHGRRFVYEGDSGSSPMTG